MRFILLFLYEILVLLPVLFFSTVAMSVISVTGCALGKRKFFGYYPGVVWGRLLCLTALSPVKVSGHENIEPNKPYIFVANHQGAADIILISGYIGHNFRWMLRKEIKDIFCLGWCCDKTNQVWVDSHGSSGMMHTIRQAIRILKDGISMVIFPEGTRSATGEIGRFKKGAFSLAAMLKVQVVPVTINGPFQILPKGKWIFNPHQLTMTIHKPLQPQAKNETGDDYTERLMKESYQIISTELARIKAAERE